MATLTGENLLNSILDSTGVELNALLFATTSARLQQMIDDGTLSKLSAAIAVSAFSTEINAATEASALADVIETNQGLIEAAADQDAVDAIDFPDYSGPVTIDYTLTASAESVEEGKAITFTVTASQAVTEDTTVTFNIITDGYDAEEADFQSPQLTQTATILAGQTTATFSVNPPQDGIDEETETFGVSVSVDGQTLTADSEILDIDSLEYVLTTDRDVATANIFYASQTQFDVDGKGPTLQTNDILTGFADRNDNKLIVTDLTPGVANSNLPTGLSLNNIQIVELNATGNTAGSGFSTVPHSSVTQLTGNTDGAARDLYLANNANTGTETTVNVMQTSYAAAAGITVSGGHDVTVTSNGTAGVRVGNQNLGTVPTSAQVATGDVDIVTNSTGAAPVQVFGGQEVDVTVTSNSNTGAIDIGNTGTNTGNSSAGGLANATGDVTVDTKGSGAVNVFGGDNVTVERSALAGTNQGGITVGDVNYVTESNLPGGDVNIMQTFDITYNGLAGSSNNASTSGDLSVYGGNDVTIETNAANDINIGNLGATKEDALNPAGIITVTNTGIVNAAAASDGVILITGGTDVDVETTGANVTIGRAANAGVADAASNPTGNVDVTQTMNGAGFGRTVTIDGGVDVTVNAKGQNVLIGNSAGSAPTGEVVVEQSDIFTGNNHAILNGTNPGNVSVFGGTDVTVNTTGGNVVVGGVVAGANVVPSGAVDITNTFGGIGDDDVTVRGGTTVNIMSTQTDGDINVGGATADDLNAAGTELKNAALSPTGDVTIVNQTVSGGETANGTGNVDVYSNGAETVSITGGDVDNLVDIQSTLATGGSNAGKAIGTSTLKNAVIDNQVADGAVAIKSDVFESLTVTNQKGAADTITITNNTASHGLTITQGGNSTVTTQVVDATAGTVNITDNGTASTKELRVDAAKATTATIDNAAGAVLQLGGVNTELTSVMLTGEGSTKFAATDVFGTGNLSKVMTVDASGATGDVTAAFQALGTSVSNDLIAQEYKGGSGVDTVTINSNASGWATKVKVDGGNGDADVLVANYAAAGTDVALGNAANVKGFEVLRLGALADSAGGNYDASGFSTVQTGTAAGNIAFTNTATGLTLDVQNNTATANGDNFGIMVTGANYSATNTSMTVNLGTSGTTAANSKVIIDNGALVQGTGDITANGVETLTVNAIGGYQTKDTNVATINGTASNGAATLAIGGDRALTLTSDMGFTKIDASGNTGTTVDVSAANVSNSGVTFTGGASKLVATGSNDAGTFQTLVTLAGTTAPNWAVGETAVVTVNIGANSSIYTYTAAGNATAAEVATELAASINANASAGNVVRTTAGAGVNTTNWATLSGGNIVLANNAAFEVGTTESGTNGTIADSLLGGQQYNQIVLTEVGGDLAAGDTITVNVNGTAYTTTATAGAPNAVQFAVADGMNGAAANIVAQITAANPVGLSSATVLSGGTAATATVAIVSQIGQTNLITTGATAGGTVDTAVDTNNILMNTVNNLFTSGAGGGEYKAGLGGSFSTVTKSFGSGSETVDLTNSAAKTDTLVLKEGAIVTDNGSKGGVTAYQVGSLSASDTLVFRNAADNGTQDKTILVNSVTGVVNTVNNAANMAAVFDSTGALNTKFANLTYTISNGVITFGATGGNSLAQFTVDELIKAAQLLVCSTTTGGANKVAAFSHNGKSYVVASDNANTLGGSAGAGSDTDNVVVELKDVASVKGFGSLFGENTIVSSTVDNLTGSAANNGGVAIDVTLLDTSQTLDYTGFSAATFAVTNAEAAASTKTTLFNNLAAASEIAVDHTGAGAGNHVGLLKTDQIGTDGLNSLKVTMGGAVNGGAGNGNTNIINQLTTNGAGLVSFNAQGAAQTVQHLIDATNSMSNLMVTGAQNFTLTKVDSTALSTVNAKDAGGVFTFGGAADRITQDDLTIQLATAQNSTIWTSGLNNSITQETGAGVVTINASGGNNTINVKSTAAGNTITANGAEDTISVGTGGYTVVATGADTTTNIASDAGAGAGATTVTVGTNATVNIGTLNVANNGAAETVKVVTAVTGGDSSNYAETTINFVNAANVDPITENHVIDFSGTADVFTLLGATMAVSQVNVATATSLEEALDMAANWTLLTQAQGAAAPTLGANAGEITWMQYEGDTYIVAMVNDTGAAVVQDGLDENDIVVKLTGLYDLTGAGFAAEAITI